MPRPKRLTVLTRAPAHCPAAIDEWKEGVEVFLEWANRARTSETTLPAAIQANEALTAFSEGRFHVPYAGLSAVAVAAGKNILSHVRDSHWHLRLCPWCDRWLLAKAENRKLCRRTECKQRTWAKDQAARDAALRALGGLPPRRARKRTKSTEI